MVGFLSATKDGKFTRELRRCSILGCPTQVLLQMPLFMPSEAREDLKRVTAPIKEILDREKAEKGSPSDPGDWLD